ncbi:hypothetical protein GCM10011504_34320 [Siccirubricoccus deserti]|uniref:PEP-CTERM sorting domain-containing protein n=1 Tax=Siccirubricoccus deserti TaxID=2013562 RepID=A0A9X0UJH5_9PROT|nr:hypothetical protein [Siccirubricoccus deserti]MBC4018115.1 hypothetical protein [Siccirubricoccus deserti]GGC53116.1 hypothetical protein GCM10011504_34320 [Siccirubricoccus deserti]
MQNFTKRFKSLRRSLLAAAILAFSAPASMAAVSLTVGNFDFYIDGCSLTPTDCSNLTLTAHGSGGVSISAPGALVANGDDLSFTLFITPLNGVEIAQLSGILINGAGATFGWIINDAYGSGLVDLPAGSATASSNQFAPQSDYIEVTLDLNAENGGPIHSFIVSAVPAPASVLVFLVGLAGLIGAGVSRRASAT